MTSKRLRRCHTLTSRAAVRPLKNTVFDVTQEPCPSGICPSSNEGRTADKRYSTPETHKNDTRFKTLPTVEVAGTLSYSANVQLQLVLIQIQIDTW